MTTFSSAQFKFALRVPFQVLTGISSSRAFCRPSILSCVTLFQSVPSILHSCACTVTGTLLVGGCITLLPIPKPLPQSIFECFPCLPVVPTLGIFRLQVMSTDESSAHYTTTYIFEQLIDHNKPELGTFEQRYWHTWEWYEPGTFFVMVVRARLLITYKLSRRSHYSHDPRRVKRPR